MRGVSVDSGAGTGSGSANGQLFEISGTVGQFDAGRLAGGDYTLNGGFWTPGVVAPHQELLFADSFEAQP